MLLISSIIPISSSISSFWGDSREYFIYFFFLFFFVILDENHIKLFTQPPDVHIFRTLFIETFAESFVHEGSLISFYFSYIFHIPFFSMEKNLNVGWVHFPTETCRVSSLSTIVDYRQNDHQDVQNLTQIERFPDLTQIAFLSYHFMPEGFLYLYNWKIEPDWNHIGLAQRKRFSFNVCFVICLSLFFFLIKY